MLGQMPISTVSGSKHLSNVDYRFITSQHGHGGYLCTGINNSLNLQKIELASPSLLPKLDCGENILESLARESILPCVPTFPLLPSLSPHSLTSM